MPHYRLSGLYSHELKPEPANEEWDAGVEGGRHLDAVLGGIQDISSDKKATSEMHAKPNSEFLMTMSKVRLSSLIYESNGHRMQTSRTLIYFQFPENQLGPSCESSSHRFPAQSPLKTHSRDFHRLGKQLALVSKQQQSHLRRAGPLEE